MPWLEQRDVLFTSFSVLFLCSCRGGGGASQPSVLVNFQPSKLSESWVVVPRGPEGGGVSQKTAVFELEITIFLNWSSPKLILLVGHVLPFSLRGGCLLGGWDSRFHWNPCSCTYAFIASSSGWPRYCQNKAW